MNYIEAFFLVGRCFMWAALAMFPIFCIKIDESDHNSMGGTVFFGFIVQILWVASAVGGWFK